MALDKKGLNLCNIKPVKSIYYSFTTCELLKYSKNGRLAIYLAGYPMNNYTQWFMMHVWFSDLGHAVQ